MSASLMSTTGESYFKTLFDKVLMICKKGFFIALGFSFLINALMLFVPIYSLQIMDRVLSSGSLETLMMLSMVGVGAVLGISLLSAISSFLLNHIGEDLDQLLSSELLNAAIANSCVHQSALGSQILRDFNTIKTFITGPTLMTLLDLPWFVLYLGAIFLIHSLTGFMVVAGVMLLLGLALINEKVTQQEAQQANEVSVKSCKMLRWLHVTRK